MWLPCYFLIFKKITFWLFWFFFTWFKSWFKSNDLNQTTLDTIDLQLTLCIYLFIVMQFADSLSQCWCSCSKTAIFFSCSSLIYSLFSLNMSISRSCCSLCSIRHSSSALEMSRLFRADAPVLVPLAVQMEQDGVRRLWGWSTLLDIPCCGSDTLSVITVYR